MNLAEFRELFRQRAASVDYEENKRIGRLIKDQTLQTCAPFVVDLAGFSQRFIAGDLSALDAAFDMIEDAERAVRNHCGRIVKVSGDNLFAAFGSVALAVEAAKELASKPVGACIGIGWGPVYLLDDDFYGWPVNEACLLGEDIAGACDILLTPAAAWAWGGHHEPTHREHKGRTVYFSRFMR